MFDNREAAIWVIKCFQRQRYLLASLPQPAMTSIPNHPFDRHLCSTKSLSHFSFLVFFLLKTIILTYFSHIEVWSSI